ncbi:Acetamidase [Cytospora mali]|uniref:amidase n=1 Tax=Cytospora mali TaxID=578113 RepID=A0A194VB45_CYTMA|nr:Acetamidase [Valsa mali var. pyri (nom. inval.)]
MPSQTDEETLDASGLDTSGCDPVKTKRTTPYKPWQEIAAAKKAEQRSRIPEEWIIQGKGLPIDAVDLRPIASLSGVLSDRELEITSQTYDATALLAKIADATYSSVEVTTAFSKRAAIAHQVCNCLTEIMFADAIAAAEKLDEKYNRSGRTECFHIKGYDASDGYISRAFDPSTTDSYLVSLVQAAGAVIIAKTNTPQTMLVAEAHNNLFGRTKNPVVSHLTCGGSSGGEASVLAFRGSPLGIGTDVGGSIRVPAAANGIYGYKPSFGVLPMLGYAASSWTGMNTGVPAVCGPMGHSVRDLSLLAKVVRASRPWVDDPTIIPYICERGSSDRLPVVGVIEKSGLTPHPPVLRGIREASEKLRQAGYQVKSFEPVDFMEIDKVTRQLFTLDGLSYQKRELSKVGEPPVPSVKNINFWEIPPKKPEEMWVWNTKRLAIQKQMLDLWRAAGVDVVLCPAGPHTAVKPDEWSHIAYTVAWNAVDYPAVIIPYTHADADLDPVYENFEPLSKEDEKSQACYDPKLMHGAPVNLQIVAQRLCDEQLLKDVEIIDRVLNEGKT